jgi:hypothetical protein
MKKLVALAMVMGLMSSPVLAQGRYSHRNHGHHHGHGFRHTPAPYIAGALGLAIIGSIIYDQYGRRCYRQVIGHDSWGDPVTRRICE